VHGEKCQNAIVWKKKLTLYLNCIIPTTLLICKNILCYTLNQMKITLLLTKKNIAIGGIALGVILVVAGIVFFREKSLPNVWYVEQGMEDTWGRILREARPPDPAMETVVWDGENIPAVPGILITTKPWKTGERVTVYPRLSWDLEYQGAIVLALDPWMIFYKQSNPMLTSSRVLSETGGSGLLIIPGSDGNAVRAWTSRLMYSELGAYSSDEQVWWEWEQKLFSGNRFPPSARGYDWHAALFRLMSNEPAWLYAPLSTIRRYRDPRKAILDVAAFPELGSSNQYSLQVKILWALPTGSVNDKEKLAQTIEWLKNPETQTIIADSLEWIPADPYGKPYDPISFSAHRVWLTSPLIYTLEE